MLIITSLYNDTTSVPKSLILIIKTRVLLQGLGKLGKPYPETLTGKQEATPRWKSYKVC